MLTKLNNNVVSISLDDWLPDNARHKERARQWIAKFTDESVPNQPFHGVIVSEKNFNTLIKIAESQLNQYDKIMSDKAHNKWLCPQGGTMSKSVMDEGFQGYCEERHTGSYDDERWRDIIAYSRYLFQKYQIYFDSDTFIIRNPRELYNTYDATHRSSPGITAEGDRRDKNVRVRAIKEAISAPTHMDPILAGMRYKDSKYRNIFCDSISNYFRETRVFHKLFKFIEKQPWNMHYPNSKLAEIIALLRGKASYAADFKAMDKHFSLRDFKALIEQIGDLLQIPRTEIDEMITVAEELFYTDVVVATKVYIGLKNLLSGLYVTHDPESLRNFLNLAYVFERLNGFEVVYHPRKLKRNQCYIVVCGDDSAVILGRELSDDELKKIISDHVQISSYVGQELEFDKVDYSTDIVTFCKNTFALRPLKGFKLYDDKRTPVPKYPCNKCLNALYRPEDIPHFPKKQDLIIWTCAIMDNAYGCTSWKSVVKALVDMNQDLFSKTYMTRLEITDEMQSILDEDWWFRNYAMFDLPKSPTYQLIKSLVIDR